MERKKEKWQAGLVVVALVCFVGYMCLMWWIGSRPVPEVNTDVIQHAVHTSTRH